MQHFQKLILLIILLSPGLATAAGPYDGIYIFENDLETTYASIHQNGSVMIMALFDVEDKDWEAYRGIIDDGIVDMETIVGDGQISLTIEFAEDSGGIVILNDCIPDPGSECSFDPPISFPLIKIF